MASDAFLHVPDGWSVKPLLECTDDQIISYGIVQPGSHVEGGIPIVRVNNFADGGLDTTSVLRVAPSIEDKFSRTRLKGGEVLLTLVGSTGQSVIAPENLKGWNVPRAIAVIRADNSIGARWINICLQSHATKSFLDSRANTTVQKTLNLKDVREIPILIPPRKTKSFIESAISSIDDKIELNRQMNATLEAMAQALFKSWFVDFDPVIDNALAAGHPIPEPLHTRAEARRALGDKRKPLPEAIQKQFPSRFVFNEEMGWVPEGWDVTPFGSLIETTIGGDWGKEESDEKHDKRVVIIRGTDIPSVQSGQKGAAPSRWVEKKKFESRQLIDSDLVLEVSGGSPKQPTGRSVYVTDATLTLFGGAVVPASFCRKLRPKSKELGLYAAMHLNRIYALGKMWGYQNQSTGISNFQTKTFLEVEPVLLPVGSELLESFFELARPLVDRARSHDSEELAQVRDTLLPKLLSGQLRIPDAEKLIEEASA